MRIVIVGDGKVGFALAEQLSREGHDVVIIDSNKSVLMDALESLDVMVVHGNGAAVPVQQQAGVGESRLLIAATSADEVNLLCCFIAKKLGCHHTIARVRNPEYASQRFFLKDELGLSLMINPEQAAASEIFRLLQFPPFLKRDSFAKGRVEIVELVVREDSPMNGSRLADLYGAVKVKVLVCAVERGETVFIPDGNFRLETNDKVYVTASSGDLARLIRNLNLSNRKVKNVMIIGGSRIAFYLASSLIATGVDVSIIELDEQRCVALAESLPKANIIHADGTSRAVLAAEGIQRTDAVVTLTNMDEENLIVSMYANYLGIPKVVTKINRTEYNEVFNTKGIDCVVSPKQLCANDIVRYVRAMENTIGGSVLTLHRLVNEKVEALEFSANDTTRHLNETLASITLKPNLLIACINHQGQIIIPKGDNVIEKGDTVIVVAHSDCMIRDLNEAFADDDPGRLGEGIL